MSRGRQKLDYTKPADSAIAVCSFFIPSIAIIRANVWLVSISGEHSALEGWRRSAIETLSQEVGGCVVAYYISLLILPFGVMLTKWLLCLLFKKESHGSTAES